MTTIYVSATGTEVGKTYVTCRLLRELADAGYRGRALKPVISGFDAADAATSDTGLILQALGLPVSDDNIAAISPWRYAAPLAPDMAARLEGTRVPFDELLEFCRRADQDSQVTLIEGVGGVMVPLDERHTVLDWIGALAAPVVLVAGTYLGTLSHTLTAAGMLAARELPLAGIVLSESTEQPVPAAETAQVLQRFLPATPVLELPRGASEPPALLSLLRPYLGTP